MCCVATRCAALQHVVLRCNTVHATWCTALQVGLPQHTSHAQPNAIRWLTPSAAAHSQYCSKTREPTPAQTRQVPSWRPAHHEAQRVVDGLENAQHGVGHVVLLPRLHLLTAMLSVALYCSDCCMCCMLHSAAPTVAWNDLTSNKRAEAKRLRPPAAPCTHRRQGALIALPAATCSWRSAPARRSRAHTRSRRAAARA